MLFSSSVAETQLLNGLSESPETGPVRLRKNSLSAHRMHPANRSEFVNIDDLLSQTARMPHFEQLRAVSGRCGRDMAMCAGFFREVVVERFALPEGLHREDRLTDPCCVTQDSPAESRTNGQMVRIVRIGARSFSLACLNSQLVSGARRSAKVFSFSGCARYLAET